MTQSRLEGDWKALENIAKNFKSSNSVVRSAAKTGIVQSAMLLEREIKQHLYKQDLPHQRLNAAYLAYKVRSGLSQQTLIATGTMARSITHEIKDRGLSAFIGLLRKTGGEGQVLIGAVMEYGSKKRNIPARPFITPTFAENKDEIVRLITEKLEKALASVARKR